MDHQQSAQYCRQLSLRLMASIQSDFFQGLVDRGIFYWPKHSRETQLSNIQEEVLDIYFGPMYTN
jgi:hypothetical protein